MAAGIPGTGIGGLFYALLALFMPLRKLFVRDRGAVPARRWRAVGLQLGLVGGILAAMALTAWGVGALVGWLRPDPVAAERALGGLGTASTSAMARATLLASAVALAAVLVVVQVLRLVVRAKAPGSGHAVVPTTRR